MVAFIHDAKAKAETLGGGRRAVDVDRPADRQRSKRDGRYFNGAGGCVKCHSLSGDFAKVGAAMKGWRCCIGCCIPVPVARLGTGSSAPDRHRDDQ